MVVGMKASSPSQAASNPQQLALFEFSQERRVDGSFVVTPRRLVDNKPISVKRAAGLLHFKDRKAVYRLISTGQIRAWKPKSVKDNGKYRVDLGSVMEYLAAREREARGG